MENIHPSVSSRDRVLDCVRQHPGAHLRDVARRCDLPLGTALYHLDRLEGSGALAVRRDGRYKRFYEASTIGRPEKELLSALRHAAPRRLVLALLANGPATQRELAAMVQLSRSTVSFHASGLAQQGLLRRIDDRPEKRYEVADEVLARDVLERYHDSLVTPEERALILARVPGDAEADVEGADLETPEGVA